MTDHPRLHLDSAFTNPIRLSIMAALTGVDEVDFKTVRESLAISDSALSKHSSALEEQGYVKVRKGYVGKRPRTWLSATKQGHAAFDRHVAALRQLTGIAN